MTDESPVTDGWRHCRVVGAPDSTPRPEMRPAAPYPAATTTAPQCALQACSPLNSSTCLCEAHTAGTRQQLRGRRSRHLHQGVGVLYSAGGGSSLLTLPAPTRTTPLKTNWLRPGILIVTPQHPHHFCTYTALAHQKIRVPQDDTTWCFQFMPAGIAARCPRA